MMPHQHPRRPSARAGAASATTTRPKAPRAHPRRALRRGLGVAARPARGRRRAPRGDAGRGFTSGRARARGPRGRAGLRRGRGGPRAGRAAARRPRSGHEAAPGPRAARHRAAVRKDSFSRLEDAASQSPPPEATAAAAAAALLPPRAAPVLAQAEHMSAREDEHEICFRAALSPGRWAVEA